MNIQFLKSGISTLKTVVSKNSPAIAAGLAVAAMGGAIWQTIRATKKLDEAMTKAYVKKNEAGIDKMIKDGEPAEETVELTATEKAVVYARCYWPAAALFILATSLIVGSVCLANHQIKALALMATTAETTLNEYQKATSDVVGEKKAGDIRDKMNQNRVANNPPRSEDFVFHTGHGNTLCYDPLSGRYFYSDIDFIRHQINLLNETLLEENFVSVNDFYEALDLEGVKDGSERGWHANDSTGLLNVKYTSAKVTPDGQRTAFVVDIQNSPRHDFIDDLY